MRALFIFLGIDDFTFHLMDTTSKEDLKNSSKAIEWFKLI